MIDDAREIIANWADGLDVLGIERTYRHESAVDDGENRRALVWVGLASLALWVVIGIVVWRALR